MLHNNDFAHVANLVFDVANEQLHPPFTVWPVALVPVPVDQGEVDVEAVCNSRSSVQCAAKASQDQR